MDENLDEKAIRDLEEILSTKIYPGTEIMRDVGSHHFVKASGTMRQSQADGDAAASPVDAVLVPQPDNDPADPLNWTPFWKAAAVASATALSFSLNIGPLSLAPMFTNYMEEWDRSLADVVQFTGVAILVLGFSNFIWVPIMVAWGRRPVAIASTLMCVCSSIWRACATSYGSFMGASVLHGLGAGPSETLMPQVIADVIFLHDRGKYQTLYFSIYFISLMIGPIISGSMAFHTGWRSFWWFNTGLLLLTLCLQVLLFPETRYERKGARSAAAARTASSSSQSNDSTKPTEVGHENAEIEPVDNYLGTSKPTAEHFWLFQCGGRTIRSTSRTLLRELWLPWYLHLFPVVEFAAFVVSWSASCFLMVNLSQTQAFAAPPYNYSSQTIGLFNLAVFGGAALGLVTCGPLSDRVAAVLTRRNNGVREPEMRLVAMAPYVVAMVVGSVVVAVGYDHHWPWQAIVIVGYGLLGLQVAALPSIASTYAIDSYKPATGPLFVAITVNKNVWGYGMARFLTPWAAESGFRAPLLTNMALTLFFCLYAIPFWFWGKRMRGLTKDSFVHKM